MVEPTIEVATPSRCGDFGYVNPHDFNIAPGEVQTDLMTRGGVTVRLVL